MFVLKHLKHYLLNTPGWHTDRKIVVIHSDDWGSIRMPSHAIREKLNQHPDITADDPYCLYDTLESNEDLEALFEVLQSVKDKNGRHAVLTANCLMANPDFEKIRASGFNAYYFETLDKTFDRFNKDRVLDAWRWGLQAGVFIPQFHGREHVNVSFWMEKLRQGHAGVRLAFDHGVFGVNFKNLGFRKLNFQAAWDYTSNEQALNILSSIEEGLNLFQQNIGYASTTAIAPAYVWSMEQERTLWHLGIKSMQGIPFQYIPSYNNLKFSRVFKSTQLHRNKMGHQIRNAFFEPSLYQTSNAVDECLKRIQIAFQMRKPAIIGSHRVNFIGGLDESNRTKNLKHLRELLNQIVRKWPEVEFMSSDDFFKI